MIWLILYLICSLGAVWMLPNYHMAWVGEHSSYTIRGIFEELGRNPVSHIKTPTWVIVFSLGPVSLFLMLLLYSESAENQARYYQKGLLISPRPGKCGYVDREFYLYPDQKACLKGCSHRPRTLSKIQLEIWRKYYAENKLIAYRYMDTVGNLFYISYSKTSPEELLRIPNFFEVKMDPKKAQQAVRKVKYRLAAGHTITFTEKEIIVYELQ